MHQAEANDNGAGVEREPAHAAARALERSGAFLGWGLLALGLLRGASVAVERALEGNASGSAYARAIFDAAATALAFGLAGWASSVACRVAAAGIAHRADRVAGEWIGLARRTAAAVERLVEVLERRPVAVAPANPPEPDRAQLLVEIDDAARSGRRAEAEERLDRFDVLFPGDPAVAALRERLEAARRDEAEGHLAQIDAARRVKDPFRVLELFRAAGSSLEADRRGELERDLAKWFLDVVHRRLRVVPIQVDVVQLAAEVADTFGTTVEGASLRASLPTLRRSVGLCPRCAQPYRGTAAACPQCQAGAAPRPPAGGVTPATPTEDH